MYMVQLGDKKYYIEVNDQLAKIQKIEADFDDLPDFDDDDAAMGNVCAVTAPLPGNICEIPVQKGQQVKKDDVLFVCETMKMELEVRAPASGVLVSVKVQKGQHVEKGQSLGEIAPE